MLTDVETDSLAREIITKVVAQIQTFQVSWSANALNEIKEVNGEPILVFTGSGYTCEYMRFLGVRKAIAECEELYEAFGVEVYDSDSGSVIDRTMVNMTQPPESRLELVPTRAECAALHLIHTLKLRLEGMVEDAIEDGTVVGKTILLSTAGWAVKDTMNGYSALPR